MTESPNQQEQLAASERRFATWVSYGLPTITIIGAILVSIFFSFGPGLLIAAFGVLLGAIAFLWASIRTLNGDAPLPEQLEVASSSYQPSNTAQEKKLSILVALKDLENEKALGKIDEADFLEISKKYREQAKALMRELDHEIEPFRAQAEKLAEDHLKKAGLFSKQTTSQETNHETS